MEGDWLTYTEAAERPNRREARGELAHLIRDGSFFEADERGIRV